MKFGLLTRVETGVFHGSATPAIPKDTTGHPNLELLCTLLPLDPERLNSER